MRKQKSMQANGRIEAVLHEIETRLEWFRTERPIRNAHEGFGIIRIEFMVLENKIQFSARSAEDYRWLRIDSISLAAAAIHFVAVITDDRYARVLPTVEAELDRAMEAYDPFSSEFEAVAVIREEVEELWDEVKKKADQRDLVKMRKEAIQVAAMAVRTVIDLCGSRKKS